jgi:hypothetical protein
MNIQDLIEDLLVELSYQSPTGVPDLKDRETIGQIYEYFNSLGLSEVGQELINNLLSEAPKQQLAQDKKFKNAQLNKVVQYKDKDGNDKEGLVGNLLRLGTDQPGREAAERAISGLSDEDREALNKELGGEGGGGEQPDQQGGMSGGQQQTQQGTALNPDTEAGKNFTDQLSPSDNAYTGKPKEAKGNKTNKTLSKQAQRDLDSMKSKSENWTDQLDEEQNKLLQDSLYHIEIVMSEDATDEEKRESAQWLVDNAKFSTNEKKDKAYLGKLGGLRKILSNMAKPGSKPTERLVAEMEKHVQLKEVNFSGIKKKLTSAAKPDLGKENEFSPKNNPKVDSFFKKHPQLSKVREGLWGLFGVKDENGQIKMPSNKYAKEYLEQSFNNPALTRTIEVARGFVASGELDPTYVTALEQHQQRLAKIAETYEIPSEEAAKAIDDSYEQMIIELHESDSDAAGSVLKQLAENRLYEVELARGEEVYLPSNGSFPGGDKIKVNTLERVSLISCKWGKKGRIYGCPANAKAITSLHPNPKKRNNQGQYLGEDGFTLLINDDLIKGNTTSETQEKTQNWIEDTLREVGLNSVFSKEKVKEISKITTEYLEYIEGVKRELKDVKPDSKKWELFAEKIKEKESELGDKLRKLITDEEIAQLIGKNNVGNLTKNNQILPHNLLGAIEIANNIRTSEGYGLEHNKQYYEKGESKFVTQTGTANPDDYSITFRDKRTPGRTGGGVQMSFSGDSKDKIEANLGEDGIQTDLEGNSIFD